MKQIKVIRSYDNKYFEESVNEFLKGLYEKEIDVDTIYLEYVYDKGNNICFIEWDEFEEE